MLSQLEANVLTPPAVGARPELQTGWIAGRHLNDVDFDPQHVVFGDTLLFAMRMDTNTVPAEVKRSLRMAAELALASESDTGFLSRREKRDAKEEAEDRCRVELASGKHVRSKIFGVVWDVPNRILFAPIFNDAASSAFRDLFGATFEDAYLEPLGAGRIAQEWIETHGGTRSFDDASPSPFTGPPAGSEDDRPYIPWAVNSPEPRDFLGNEFLIWLWSTVETQGPVFDDGSKQIALAFDRSLDMDCAWDVSGKQSLRADGPIRMPEARTALAVGKWPRKAGFIMSVHGEEWAFTFQGDRFLVSAGKLPKPEDQPQGAREVLEQRIASAQTLDDAMLALYGLFLKVRLGPQWSDARSRIRRWIAQHNPARAVPAVVQPAQPVVMEISDSAQEPVETA